MPEVLLSTADATEYTEAGYGKDVEPPRRAAVSAPNQSVKKAQTGIIFIDDLDKLARRAQSYKTGGGTRDIGGEGVQRACQLRWRPRGPGADDPDAAAGAAGPGPDRGHHRHPVYRRRNLSAICMTARALRGRSVLPGSGDSRADERSRRSEPGAGTAPPYAARLRTDLIGYGMLAGFLAGYRCVQLDPLTEDELWVKLTSAAGALVREYEYLLHLDDVPLNFSDAALREIARAAWPSAAAPAAAQPHGGRVRGADVRSPRAPRADHPPDPRLRPLPPAAQ